MLWWRVPISHSFFFFFQLFISAGLYGKLRAAPSGKQIKKATKEDNTKIFSVQRSSRFNGQTEKKRKKKFIRTSTRTKKNFFTVLLVFLWQNKGKTRTSPIQNKKKWKQNTTSTVFNYLGQYKTTILFFNFLVTLRFLL